LSCPPVVILLSPPAGRRSLNPFSYHTLRANATRRSPGAIGLPLRIRSRQVEAKPRESPAPEVFWTRELIDVSHEPRLATRASERL